jgi:membrane-associated phospholipid phosphatase
VLYYGLRKKIGWLNYVFTFIMVGIWFSAVYSSHHYLLDVMAGASCATVGILFFQRGLLRMEAFKKIMAYYHSKI